MHELATISSLRHSQPVCVAATAIGGQNDISSLSTVEAFAAASPLPPPPSLPPPPPLLPMLPSLSPAPPLPLSQSPWSSASQDMPTARFSVGVGVLNTILYGACSRESACNRLPATQRHVLSSPIASPAAVGGDSDGSFVDTVEAFDGASWSAAASISTARSFVGVGVLGKTLYGVRSPW